QADLSMPGRLRPRPGPARILRTQRRRESSESYVGRSSYGRPRLYRQLAGAGGVCVTSAHSGPQPRRYEISVRRRLGEMMLSAFPALLAQTRGEDTVLTGALADQAALYGVLAEIEALGLELLEVRRVPPH